MYDLGDKVVVRNRGLGTILGTRLNSYGGVWYRIRLLRPRLNGSSIVVCSERVLSKPIKSTPSKKDTSLPKPKYYVYVIGYYYGNDQYRLRDIILTEKEAKKELNRLENDFPGIHFTKWKIEIHGYGIPKIAELLESK